MPRETEFRASFTGGEVSPMIEGRADIERHQKSCRLLRNFLPTVQGPAMRRGGTRHIGAVADESKKARLTPFEFSAQNNVLLEWSGDKRLRFIEKAGGAYGYVTAPDQGVSWENGDFSGGPEDWASVGSPSFDGGACTLSTSGQQLQRSAIISTPGSACAIRFTLSSNSGGPGTTVDFKVGTSVGGEEILNRPNVGGYSYLFVFTPGAPNTTIHFSWTQNTGTAVLKNVEFLNDQPVEIETLYDEAKLAGFDYAQSADVVYLTGDGSIAPYKLVRDSTTATGPASTTYYEWLTDIIAFTDPPADWGADNYPRTVAFYEDRLWFGGTPKQPDTLYASKKGNYQDMTDGANATDALEFTIAAQQLNRICWMNSGDDLIIGTVGSEFALRSPDSREPVTPDNVSIKRQTGHGSAIDVRSITTEEAIIFARRSGNQLIEYLYDGGAGRYTGRDLSLLAEHLFETQIHDMAWQGGGANRLWICLADGALVSLTYSPVEQVVAFASHQLGGTDAAVESVTAMADDDGGEDVVFFAVKRTIGTHTRRYVEYLTKGLTPTQDKEDAFFVDSGLTYSGAPTTTISGLSYLDGEIVAINGDGAVIPPQTVSSGSITLPSPVSKAVVGLAYASVLQPQLPASGSAVGVALGRRMILKEARVSVYRSSTFKLGPPRALKEVVFREVSDPMGTSPSLKSQTVDDPTYSDYADDSVFEIRTNEPLPLTIRWIALTVEAVD